MCSIYIFKVIAKHFPTILFPNYCNIFNRILHKLGAKSVIESNTNKLMIIFMLWPKTDKN